jgi:hypothetical protein
MSTEMETPAATIGAEVTVCEEVPMVRRERWEEIRRLWVSISRRGRDGTLGRTRNHREQHARPGTGEATMMPQMRWARERREDNGKCAKNSKAKLPFVAEVVKRSETVDFGNF